MGARQVSAILQPYKLIQCYLVLITRADPDDEERIALAEDSDSQDTLPSASAGVQVR